MNQITVSQTPKEFARIWDEGHISKKLPSNVRLADLKNYLETLSDLGLKIDEAGRSYGGREIYQIEWGKGPHKVFFWSQMHGDEPTATTALVDMFAFLQANAGKKDWVKKLEESVTIRAVPMLNPDGAEVFQRRNLQWIDINRDARDLKTPEGRLLKKLRDEFRPEIGFNLHNQNELTTVGRSFRQASISLLAVSGIPDKDKTYPGHERNRRICSLIIEALDQFVEGHIGRYDDIYNPRAFGDMIAAWGTPAILIETGGLYGADEMFLVKLNFIAYLTALQSIVDGSLTSADPGIYEKLPFNSSGRIFDLILRNAEVLVPGKPTSSAATDIAINRERRRAQFIPPVYVRRTGDLSAYKGLKEQDITGYYLVPKEGTLRPGSLASFLFYKKTRVVDWDAENLEAEFPPDAVYAFGRWVKPISGQQDRPTD